MRENKRMMCKIDEIIISLN